MTIDKGKTLSIKTLAINEKLTKTGEREVFFELNGQLRSVFIKDKEAVKVGGNPSGSGVYCEIIEMGAEIILSRAGNPCPPESE